MIKYKIKIDPQEGIILVEDHLEGFNPMIFTTYIEDKNFWNPKVGMYIGESEFEVDQVELDSEEQIFQLIAKPKK